MLPRIVYPGSFDPITNGHLNIIERASNVFDEIIVSVFRNPSKDPLFTMDERVELLEKSTADIKGVKVDSFSGLTMQYVKSKNASAILRGLRAVSDFEGEFQMASMNRELDGDIETVFFMTDAKYAFLSSSVVKEVAQFNGDVSSLVPECVSDALEEKYHKGEF
ncbi:MAG TPA: pantetheine-phosphate adenylyltransferase [Halanaerobiales bacterium]|nr:pantetheine-phosphate adenylyltransferase [Halanaerobiales bacterium]